MSKTEEIDLLRAFVASLPQDSYLWEYFAPSAANLLGEIETAISNDVCMTGLTQRIAEEADHKQRMKDAQELQRSIRAETLELQRINRKLQGELDDTLGAAQSLSRAINSVKYDKHNAGFAA